MAKTNPKIDDRVIFIEKIEQEARVIKIIKIGYELKLNDGRIIWATRKEFKFKRLKEASSETKEDFEQPEFADDSTA